MSSLNTFGNEMFPQFQGDSLLTFSTDGRVGYGGLDIYSVVISNGVIGSTLKHYLSPINSSMDDFNFTWNDSLNATIVSNRFGGNGDDDIWNIAREKEIVDAVIVIPPDGFEEWYDVWNMKQIYFDFDSFEAEANADFIAGCKRYAEKYGVDVTLVGHTDSRGVPAYNYNLGLDRSKWMQKQLVNAKVFNKILTESVGETELVNGCYSDSNCSEADHRLNRFVQIKLTVAEAAQK
jgi:hypothetical protein